MPTKAAIANVSTMNNVSVRKEAPENLSSSERNNKRTRAYAVIPICAIMYALLDTLGTSFGLSNAPTASPPINTVTITPII